MANKILSPVIIRMLKQMERVFQQHSVDFYVVGAMARDIQLSQKPGYGAIRGTRDVDLAILVASEALFYQVKDSLLATGLFEAHPKEPVKLFYQKSIEVDLLPFGAIENEERESRLHKPQLMAMNMPGFLEAWSSVTTIALDEITIHVCSLEGLVLLKLIAHDDNPSRTKDISDIEHILQVYFDLSDEAIYSVYFDIMEIYDTRSRNYLDLVSARVIGRKMRDLLIHSPRLKQRVESILVKRPTATWQAMLHGLLDQ